MNAEREPTPPAARPGDEHRRDAAPVDAEPRAESPPSEIGRRGAGAAVPALSSEVVEAALYRAAAEDLAAQATAYILTEEGSFVRRAELYAMCLDWSDDGRLAWVRWRTLRELVTGPNSAYPHGPLRTVLLLCCSLHDDGPAPLSQLASLDSTTARVVARGIHIATGALPLEQALGHAP
ncbi:hypothetical protein [Streptomyces sp. SID3343]|uniref:hypothetical protein n=1 Tax=Streptomyces sp. SID3343 TaxID=2690260 RepID=UPI0013680367|nr:hypothetical protein [Streptomyces sp. SID3343]MYW01612.1 hypothetical protein [Streptomyces sp. SID3343]